MPPKKKARETRSGTDIFLVGQPSEKPMNMNKPLTNGDMVRYLHYRKMLDMHKSTSWENLFSCTLVSGTGDACCSSKGCRAGEGQDLCGLAFVKYTGGWNVTGIPLMSDQSLKKQVSKLFKEWQAINKMKARLSKDILSPNDKKIVDNFENKMSQTFLASAPSADDMIRKDKSRDIQQKEEDIIFLNSMKEDRIASVSSLDRVYQGRIDNKLQRIENEKRRREK